MGLLDSLLSGMTAPGAGQKDSTAQLMQLALQLLGGGTQGGGLGALTEQFQQAGLGEQLQSWIGTGQNLPISADQLTQAFGPGRLQELAAQSGLGVDQVSGGLSQMLPQLVDGLTPSGREPEGGIGSALSELSRMMPR